MITGRKKNTRKLSLLFLPSKKSTNVFADLQHRKKAEKKLSFRNHSTVIVSQQRERASYLILCPIDKLPTEARPVKVLFKIIQKSLRFLANIWNIAGKTHLLHLNNPIRMTPQLPSTRARKTPIEVTPKNPKGIESLRLGHLSFLSSSAGVGTRISSESEFLKRYLVKKRCL